MLNTAKGEQVMSVIKVLKNGRITLPKDFREVWDIDDGQVLEGEVTGTGLLLKPKVLVDKASRKEITTKV